MFLKDINAKETSDQPLTLAQVNCKPAGTVAGVPTLESNAPWRMYMSLPPELKVGHLAKVHVCPEKLKTKNVHEIKATSAGPSESVPDPNQSSCDHMFMGPISATPLTSSVHVVSCKQKALLKMHLVLSPKGKQTHAFCQIDSGAETNIIPNSLYNKLKPTMKLTAYGANGIPNLGSCQVYVKGPDSPYPKSVQAEIVDVYDPAVNRQWLCQHKVWIF